MSYEPERISFCAFAWRFNGLQEIFSGRETDERLGFGKFHDLIEFGEPSVFVYWLLKMAPFW
jgi:hypothetical protein